MALDAVVTEPSVFQIVQDMGGVLIPLHEFVGMPVVDAQQIDAGFLIAKGWQIVTSCTTVQEYCNAERPRYIATREFWTCDCKHNFIKSKAGEPHCPLCGRTADNFDKTVWYLDELLTW